MNNYIDCIFLDIDGTINNMEFDRGAQSFTILPECVKQLNRILEDTQAYIVLISSWRYLILMKDMTLKGFEVLLRSHGIACPDRLIGNTTFDIKSIYERPAQVYQWLNDKKFPVRNHVVLDDNAKQNWEKYGLKNVLINNTTGLAQDTANKAILILRGMV